MTTRPRLPVSILHSLIIFAAIFIIYQPALNYQFVWDDNLYIVNNPAVQSWGHLPAAFTSPLTTWSGDPGHTLAAWRPVRNLSYLMDHTLYGLNPIGYHLTNILLHAITALLVYQLLRRLHQLVRPRPLSPAHEVILLFITLAWALHPVQTEIVAWVKSRDDLLASPLMLAALLATLPVGRNYESAEVTKPQSLFRLLAAPVLFTAALLSKENAIILAGLYPVFLFLLFPLPVRALVSKFSISCLTFIVIGVVFLLVRHLALGRTAQAPYPGDSPLHTVLTMLHAHTRYLQLIFWPWPPSVQSADYDNYPIITTIVNFGALFSLGVLSLFLLFFLSSCYRVKKLKPVTRLMAIGLATYTLAILPYANIIPMMQILAERFLYLPTIGIAVIISSFSGLCFSSRFCAFASKISIFLLIILTAALSLQTRHRLPVWTSELTLFTATRQANPVSWRPANQLVKAYLNAGETTAALTRATLNLRQFPRDPDIVRTAAITHLIAGHETTGTLLTNYASQLQPNDNRATQALQMWRTIQKNKNNSLQDPSRL